MANKGRPQMPATEARKAAFLEALRNSGGVFASACRATGEAHLGNEARNPPAYSTWRAVIARDPEFAAAVEEVLEECRQDVEAEIFRRAQIGVLEPVFQKGEQATDADGNPAFIRRYSDRLLLKRAAALMPEKYGERKEITVNHNVRSAISWTVSGDDLALLTPAEKADLSRLVGVLRSRRAEIAHAARLEDNRAEAEVIEAEYSEVEEADENGDFIPY